MIHILASLVVLPTETYFKMVPTINVKNLSHAKHYALNIIVHSEKKNEKKAKFSVGRCIPKRNHHEVTNTLKGIAVLLLLQNVAFVDITEQNHFKKH